MVETRKGKRARQPTLSETALAWWGAACANAVAAARWLYGLSGGDALPDVAIWGVLVGAIGGALMGFGLGLLLLGWQIPALLVGLLGLSVAARAWVKVKGAMDKE